MYMVTEKRGRFTVLQSPKKKYGRFTIVNSPTDPLNDYFNRHLNEILKGVVSTAKKHKGRLGITVRWATQADKNKWNKLGIDWRRLGNRS